MSNENETIADIIREMRRANFQPQFYQRCVNEYADRIEAALAREAPPAGNAAKLREALRESTSLLAIVDGSEYEPEITAQIDRNTGVLADTQAIAAPAQEPTPKKSDEAAFDAAVRGMNGWDAVSDPVAEIRRMRDGDTPGNAAAMREALKEQLRYWNSVVRTRDEEEMRKRTEAALSAPARNCDRYGDEDDAFAAWHDALNDGDVVSVRNAFAWLFAKAEGGAREDAGSPASEGGCHG